MEYNFELFNAVADALEALESARDILIKAQQNAEDIYINEEPKQPDTPRRKFSFLPVDIQLEITVERD